MTIRTTFGFHLVCKETGRVLLPPDSESCGGRATKLSNLQVETNCFRESGTHRLAYLCRVGEKELLAPMQLGKKKLIKSLTSC